ncbi:MAG: hypothetical protein UFJ18_00600 [Blautia sp.]|nr:hypothetical protein [Eubacteriales bacterium]MED9965279.1 hypothetical protein [Blautia sp.]
MLTKWDYRGKIWKCQSENTFAFAAKFKTYFMGKNSWKTLWIRVKYNVKVTAFNREMEICMFFGGMKING